MHPLVRSVLAGVCLSLLLGASGCEANTPPPTIETIKIGVAAYRMDDTFISALCGNLEQLAKEKERETGKKITLSVVDGRNNQPTQNDQVDGFIEQGYDVICVNMVDRSVAAVIADKAKKADIPVIFFNREPVEEDINLWQKLYYVGTDAKESGELQGKIAAEAYRKNPKIDKNGDGILQYVMLEGEPTHQDSLIRTEYSVKVLTSQGISVKKLADETANWRRSQAMAKMQQWLEQYGDEIELVLSNNDDMALGAIDALKTTDKQKIYPVVIGLDGTRPALDAVADGTLYGTVMNDAQLQANAMLELSYTLAQGELPAETIPLSERTIELQKLVSDTPKKELTLTDGHYVRVSHHSITRDNVTTEQEYLYGTQE